MPIWKVPKIEHQPEITLSSWEVVRVKYREGDDETEDRLVGIADGAGRLSSAITEFDRENMVAITRSGRKYKLHDPSKMRGDAEYMFNNIKQVTFEAELVTEEYTKGTVK